jgi:hypothetical protein
LLNSARVKTPSVWSSSCALPIPVPELVAFGTLAGQFSLRLGDPGARRRLPVALRLGGRGLPPSEHFYTSIFSFLFYLPSMWWKLFGFLK